MLSKDYVYTIEIHDKKLFRNIVESLIKGDDEHSEIQPFVFYDNDKKIRSSEILTLIVDINGFELDNKRITTSLTKKINYVINTDVDLQNKLESKIGSLFSVLLELIEEADGFCISEEIDIQKLLKVFGLKPMDLCGNIFDKMLNIIDVYSKLLENSIVCFINAKSWFSQDEFSSIINHISNRKLMVVFIESNQDLNSFQYEKKLIIDEDYVEITT